MVCRIVELVGEYQETTGSKNTVSEYFGLYPRTGTAILKWLLLSWVPQDTVSHMHWHPGSQDKKAHRRTRLERNCGYQCIARKQVGLSL